MTFLTDQAKSTNAAVATRAIKRLLAEDRNAIPPTLYAPLGCKHFTLSEIRRMPVDIAASVARAARDSALVEQIILGERRVAVRTVACNNRSLAGEALIRLVSPSNAWRKNDDHQWAMRHLLNQQLAARLTDPDLAEELCRLYIAGSEGSARVPSDPSVLRPMFATLVGSRPQVIAEIVALAGSQAHLWRAALTQQLFVCQPEVALAEARRQGVLAEAIERTPLRTRYETWKPYAREIAAQAAKRVQCHDGGSAGAGTDDSYTGEVQSPNGRSASMLSNMIADPDLLDLQADLWAWSRQVKVRLSVDAYAALSDELLAKVDERLDRIKGLAARLVETRWGDNESAWLTAEAIVDTFTGTPHEFLTVMRQMIG